MPVDQQVSLIVHPSQSENVQAEIERRRWSIQGEPVSGLSVIASGKAYALGNEGDLTLPLELGGKVTSLATYWPTAEFQLTVLALWPLALAGLVLEPPVVMVDRVTHEEEFERLSELGWPHGVDLMPMDSDPMESVRAINLIAHIKKLPDPSLLDQLYATAYQQASEIRNEDEGDWSPDIVRGRSNLAYRLRYSPGEDTDLLTSQWLGEEGGRLGALGMADLAETLLN